MLTRLSSSTVLAALILAAVDVGTSEVGCGITPNAVLQDLYGMSGDVCPPGSGV